MNGESKWQDFARTAQKTGEDEGRRRGQEDRDMTLTDTPPYPSRFPTVSILPSVSSRRLGLFGGLFECSRLATASWRKKMSSLRSVESSDPPAILDLIAEKRLILSCMAFYSCFLQYLYCNIGAQNVPCRGHEIKKAAATGVLRNETQNEPAEGLRALPVALLCPRLKLPFYPDRIGRGRQRGRAKAERNLY
jgi:hypothetical protein